MSVILETSLGDITIDLLLDYAPKSCENFLKLCKTKYYNYAPIHTVQPNFSFQTGDPIGPGSKDSDGGSSIWGLINGPSQKTYVPEFNKKLKHLERGTVSMATAPSPNDADERIAGSQFIITLADDLSQQLDGKAAIFGKVAEGFDVLEKINGAFIDSSGRPLKDIRIRHTFVLEDPLPDPTGLVEPTASPVPTPAQLATVRIADDEVLAEDADQETVEKLRREREARAQALTLEMVGDLPFAEVAPPENILFVCKLNPVTRDEDLELIFSRFGTILSCEVVRDKRTGDSLQYAFVEFKEQKDCEMAYLKMQDVLIDDHRIHVDFSQSVSKLSGVWRDQANAKRRKKYGGFGGIEGLEKRTQYRQGDATERAERERDERYGMVVEEKGKGQGVQGKGRGDAPGKMERDARDGREQDRSRSPPRRDRDRDRDRKPHYRDRDDRERRRDRSRDRYRRDDRDRDRDRDRRRH
ncbi:cyclophilin-like protein [Aulographum hederae CBS 113979]|uniref:Peptidyl-prolyl cis-trans isomerase n=1 Tax=Aulographum hederae CBS 113979 TaxID=1176131 RepID=A0A6G1GX25_9PEZI|nr:cyclophilin-like protein [Aulographum hederae CBS 113979]